MKSASKSDVSTGEDENTLYYQLADKLRRLIQSGAFEPGEKLPSIRRLSEEHRVSLNTAKSALALLEDWRTIEVRPQSGHYVRRPPEELPKLSSTQPNGEACVIQTNIPTRMNAAIGSGAEPTLGAAVQSTQLMPLTVLNKSYQKVMRDLPDACFGYDGVPGHETLRKSIAKRGTEAGYVVSPDDIVITSGAKEAVYLSIKCVAPPGSIVAIESPAYYALLEVLQSLGLKAVEVACDPETGIQLDHLDHVLGKYDISACTIVSNFSNPTGSLMPEENKKRLVEILNRYQVPLVEDDVYGDLSFRSPRPRAVKAYDTEGRILYCGSFSKTLSPGLRLGWCIPGRYLQQFQLMKLVVNQCTSVAPQLVAAEILETGAYDRHLRKVRAQFAEQMDDALRAVRNCFPEGVRASRPLGGHVLWIEMPRHVDAMQMYHTLSEEGIQFAPGPIFSPSGAFKNFIRINTGFPWSPFLHRQVERMGQYIRTGK
ncbi:PLP-dependent aminotransferase family protein [Bremerella sp.]|uniref:aminotransferase-like domain-containing protein n=1 Tax=Bremerella sp. TaxID=2795602 RepID=UPI00391A21BA